MNSYGTVNYSADRTSAARYDFGITPMYKLDEATGLPEVLDEGAYFEVARGGVSNDYIFIRYMRPRRWWSPEKLHEISQAAWLGEVTSDDILVSALWIIEQRELCLKLERDPVFRAEYEAEVAAKNEAYKKESYRAYLELKEEKRAQAQREYSLLGKYPPKKLGERNDKF